MLVGRLGGMSDDEQRACRKRGSHRRGAAVRALTQPPPARLYGRTGTLEDLG
jgi:hypothetical protein